MTQEYQTISERAQKLLNMQEGYDVDFKRSLSGLEATDLVAFANSEKGGAFLIGVEEVCLENGCQRGEVVGCDVSDKERQVIFSKAESCMPPIPVEVIVENTDVLPFFRIEVPSGSNKPYCTSRGTYVIRGDGRTTPLLPQQLLSIFMDAEGHRFFEKFRNATVELEKGLDAVNSKMSQEMSALVTTVHSMEEDITESFSKIFGSAENAENSSGEALGCTEETLAAVRRMDEKMSSAEEQLNTLQQKINLLLGKMNINM